MMMCATPRPNATFVLCCRGQHPPAAESAGERAAYEGYHPRSQGRVGRCGCVGLGSVGGMLGQSLSSAGSV